MNISGKVKLINETKEYGSNGFRKREIVLTTQEQYPQNILVEFIQDRTDLLDAYNIGDFVKIDINLRGREWTNDKGEVKYFNSIQGWRIEKVEDEFESQLPPLPTKEDLNISDNASSEPDDLPFLKNYVSTRRRLYFSSSQ